MQFKTDAEKHEWAELDIKNPKLHKLVALLDEYTQLNFDKEITLTEIFRTKEEFDALYSATPAEKRPADSPHCHWLAADIRSSTFSDEELDKIRIFLNTFKYKDGSKPVCLIHAIAGNVKHVHVQFC